MYHFKGSWPSLTCIRQFPFSQLTLEAVGSAKPPNGQSWLAKPSSYTNKFLQCGSIITITFHDLTTSGYWSQYRGTEASRTTSTQMEWEKKRKKQEKKKQQFFMWFLVLATLQVIFFWLFKSKEHDLECCHFVQGSLCKWCYEQGWHVWSRYGIRHKPAFSVLH